MANKKHTFDFEGILSMGIDQKNWKDIKQKLEVAFGELKIGIQEGMAEVEAQKFVEIFNKVLSKAKLPEIGAEDLRKNFEQVSQSIEKAVGLINNIDTSVLKGIETTLERVADKVDVIADKMGDIGPKKGSMDNLTKEIKEAEDELAKLSKQKEAIERGSRAKSFNREEGSITSAITRLTKNDKIIKSKAQGLLKSLNYKSPKNSIDLNEKMADVQQEYNGAKTWEQQYAALLKYKKLYDSYISHDIKVPDEFAKIGEYTAQQIEDAIPYIQNSLQNIFNVIEGKGFIAEVGFEVPNPITAEDITGGKHKLKVEVEPSAKELKGTLVYRTIYMPEDEDDTRNRKEILKQWGGAEIWTNKKEVAETYAEGQENPTMLKGTISPKNAYIIDAGGKMWDQFQSMKVIKPDAEDPSKIITTNLKDEFSELFKRVANKEFSDPADIQAQLNEEIKKLGYDVVELRNVIDTNNPDSYKALSTTYSVLDDSALQVDSAFAMHSQDRDGITTFEKKASKDNIPEYYKMPDAVNVADATKITEEAEKERLAKEAAAKADKTSAETSNIEVDAQKQITEELEKQNKLILIRRVEGDFDPNRIGNRSLDALYDKNGNPQIQYAMEDGLAGYGDGLFGSVVSSAKNLIPELLTGEIDITDKTSYFEFDVSDYNMFINHTVEQSEQLRQFLLSLQKFVGAGTILNESELIKITDLSSDQLYEQAQQIFKNFGMTKEQFNAWLENAKKESAEIAKLFKQGAVPENRHNFGTRFMQSLGYEGVLNQTGDDEYDGNTYGSVVFDPDTDKIRQGLTNGMRSWNGVEEYCRYLGVEIPQAAQKAQQAVADVNDELKITGDKADNIEQLSSIENKGDSSPESGSQQGVSINEEQLKGILTGITYNVKVVADNDNTEQNKVSIDADGLKVALHDGTPYDIKNVGEQQTVGIDETALNNALANIAQAINKPSETEKAPWALDETLKSATNPKLDAIEAAVNNIVTAINSNTQSSVPAGVSNTLSAIGNTLGAINGKIIKGVKGSAPKITTGVQTQSDLFKDRKETKSTSLSLMYTQLEAAGKLTPELEKQWMGLRKSLNAIRTPQGLTKWNEKLKQTKNQMEEIIIANKLVANEGKASFQELINVTKMYNKMSVSADKSTSPETKKFYSQEANALLAEQQRLLQRITLTEEQRAELNKLEVERQRKLNEARAKQSDKNYATEFKDYVAEEEAAVKQLIKQYELLGTMRAEADAATSGEFKNYLEGRIAEQEKLIAEASSDVYIDGNRQRELDLKADAAYYAQRQKLEEKAIKERDAAEKKSRVKALKDNINEEIKLAKKTAMTDKAGSAANRAANTYIGALSSDVALPKEFNGRLEEYKKQIDELRSEQARVNALSDPKLIDAETDSLNKKTAALNRQTQELNEQIAQYQKYNVEGAIDMGAAAISPNADLGEYQRQLTALVKQHHDGKVSIKGFNEQTKELIYTVQQRGSKAITTYNAAMTELDGKVRSVAQSTKMAEGFFDALKRKMNEIKSYVSAMSIISFVTRQIKQGIQYVKEIDLAMTELRKVTDETTESYEKFMDTASKTAAKVGSTMRDVISSTADWARLNI